MAKKKTAARRLPQIGEWHKTADDPPPAMSTFLGLWFHNNTPTVRFACAHYIDADGNGVDPDEEEYVAIVYKTRQGHVLNRWSEEQPAPDYWADCRFLIEEW